MSLSHSSSKTLASSLPKVWRARCSRSLMYRPNSCNEPRARALKVAASDSVNRASNRLTFHLPANSPSDPSVWWPMPRLGVVAARKNAGSSSLFTNRRSHPHKSLISALSKKLCPPDTL